MGIDQLRRRKLRRKGQDGRHIRQNLYKSLKFRRFRAAMLQERRMAAAEKDEAICEDCAKEQVRFPGPSHLELHHPLKVERYPHLAMDPDNVMFLCKSHHTTRTNRGE